MALIDKLQVEIVGQTLPDLTFVFDLDPVIGLVRAKARGSGTEDRYERKGLAFHLKLRDGFLAIAQAEPHRCKIIDASQSIDEINAAIWKLLRG